ncbi:MAG: hypothetical protein VX519_12565 [Myxococcota bacterium]|nr:hypothetical protein [Myxococcota bacterium]
MADKPHEPLPTKLPKLDTSAARKAVKVTRTADAAVSTSHVDIALPPDIKRGVRNRTLTAYAVLGCGAGLVLAIGAPLWVLAAIPVLGWTAARQFRGNARKAIESAPQNAIRSAAGLELLKRVESARLALESMSLNNQIFSDLIDSIRALPERIGSIETAETQCQALLDALPDAAETSAEKTALLDRIQRLKSARDEIGEALDDLTRQAAQVTAESGLDSALEEKLVRQTHALAQTAKDLS